MIDIPYWRITMPSIGGRKFGRVPLGVPPEKLPVKANEQRFD